MLGCKFLMQFFVDFIAGGILVYFGEVFQPFFTEFSVSYPFWYVRNDIEQHECSKQHECWQQDHNKTKTVRNEESHLNLLKVQTRNPRAGSNSATIHSTLFIKFVNYFADVKYGEKIHQKSIKKTASW
jgi:hypothetical protein